ncbi:MAG: sensor histidine kinase [Woeseiaceae bacterium]|nr:sensor histidine kinase [Woeseiaceae bacterium]
MSVFSRLYDSLLRPPLRLFRGAWLVTAAISVVIVLAQHLNFFFPVPFLTLMVSVAASGALGGFASGLASGMLMSVAVLYFWWNGIGPEPLTGTLLRAIIGCSAALLLGSYLGIMREQLSTLISKLEQRVDERTADLQHLSERLRDSEHRLRRTTRHWIEMEESQRRNLARELHDDIGQGLTALHLNLENSRKYATDNPSIQDLVATSSQIVGQVSDSVRQLSLNLRPSLLDDLGLFAAIREHASARFGGAEIGFDIRHTGDDQAIDPSISITAYRLLQETTMNIIKHSDASHATISIAIEDSTLKIDVEDNGRGFDPIDSGAEQHHFGLVIMRERARMMAGSCEVRSEKGAGTTVEIRLPISEGETST